MHVTADPNNVHVFNTESGNRLSDWTTRSAA